MYRQEAKGRTVKCLRGSDAEARKIALSTGRVRARRSRDATEETGEEELMELSPMSICKSPGRSQQAKVPPID